MSQNTETLHKQQCLKAVIEHLSLNLSLSKNAATDPILGRQCKHSSWEQKAIDNMTG
jgi:hypothetical protein